MNTYYLNTTEIKTKIAELKFGDKIYLSGTVFTARDAAHKKIFELLSNNEPLPFPISDCVIYYAGPTPTPENMAIGSCGPTTSSRMDPYAAELYKKGMLCSIGKGERSSEVVKAIKDNKAIYLCAIGGCGALAAKCITDCEIIAFEELGCESVKKLKFKDFPLIVGIDSKGNSIFK